MQKTAYPVCLKKENRFSHPLVAYGDLHQFRRIPALAAEDVDYLDDSAYETPAETVASIYDPLEPFNRVMFTVNDRLYIWVLDPCIASFGDFRRTGLPWILIEPASS